MLLPNRHDNTPEYRYGFQGQEKDDEIKGHPGSSINYKFRMHDPRVGRFFAVDPLTSKYPYYSPYQFSGNKLIHKIELEGLEEADPKRRTSNNRSEGDKSCGDVYHCGSTNVQGEEFVEGWYSYSDYEKVTNTNRTVTHYYSNSKGESQEASASVIGASLLRSLPKAGVSSGSDLLLPVGEIIGAGIIIKALTPDLSTTTYAPLQLQDLDTDFDDVIKRPPLQVALGFPEHTIPLARQTGSIPWFGSNGGQASGDAWGSNLDWSSKLAVSTNLHALVAINPQIIFHFSLANYPGDRIDYPTNLIRTDSISRTSWEYQAIISSPLLFSRTIFYDKNYETGLFVPTVPIGTGKQ